VFKAAGKGLAAVKRHAGKLDEAVGALSHADDAATATATGVRESIEEASSVLAKEGGGAANSADELVDVYRGVAVDHPGLPAALEGRAIPRGGHSDPGFHNAGNTQSEFTSWSTRQSVADEFATSGGPGGVTLHQRVPRSQLIRSPDGSGESEVLRLGPVEGATPLQPVTIPDWFQYFK
jgi:hypothetical protein